MTPNIPKIRIEDSTTGSATDGEAGFLKPPVPLEHKQDDARERIERGLRELEDRETKIKKDLDDYKKRINLKQTCENIRDVDGDGSRSGERDEDQEEQEEGEIRDPMNSTTYEGHEAECLRAGGIDDVELIPTPTMMEEAERQAEDEGARRETAQMVNVFSTPVTVAEKEQSKNSAGKKCSVTVKTSSGGSRMRSSGARRRAGQRVQKRKLSRDKIIESKRTRGGISDDTPKRDPVIKASKLKLGDTVQGGVQETANDKEKRTINVFDKLKEAAKRAAEKGEKSKEEVREEKRMQRRAKREEELARQREHIKLKMIEREKVWGEEKDKLRKEELEKAGDSAAGTNAVEAMDTDRKEMAEGMPEEELSLIHI